MHLISKFKPLKNNYFNLLLSLMPLSFIAGNMIININTILIILSALILFRGDIFKTKFFLIDKIIFIFFGFVIFTALFNDVFYLNKLSWGTAYATTLRSFLFLKYLLLYISIKFLIEKDYINFKLFFISCSLASLFVCFDIIYQFSFGKDIFGYEAIPGFRKLGGPFGDELIAGGYIQRFSIFSFFLIPLFYKNFSPKILKFLIPILLIIILISLILSGNRMPLLLFILLVSLIVIFNKQTRKYFISFASILLIIFSLAFTFNQKVKNNFNSFYGQISNMAKILINKDFDNNSSQYFKEFASFYDTWLLNKYIGGGIKSFRYYCHVRPNIDKNSKFVCNMHPHNYYLEILTETGLIGFFIISIIFILILYKTFYKKYFDSNSSLTYNNISVPFIFLFFVEIFPLKSTGSFFTTGNATYIFLIMAILVGFAYKEKFIENKI
tara:strand:+ start:121 stop:1440 length:1320 start_codon:yes stop_codon:yes gene_type:complete